MSFLSGGIQHCLHLNLDLEFFKMKMHTHGSPFLRVLTGFVFLYFHTLSFGQCNLEVSLGKDTIVCSSDEVVLNASVEGSVLFFKWSPESDLDNPFSLHPGVIQPKSQSFRLDVTGVSRRREFDCKTVISKWVTTPSLPNMKQNSTKPGGYIIGSLGTQLFPDAKPCEDRTTGSGSMMMVKISDTDNLKIWCEEITVRSNQDYRFEAFATGLRLNQPPIIVLDINDETLSSGTLGSFACTWQKVNGDWHSGVSTTATICLSVSMEDIGAATDFALDDIGFYEVCNGFDEVNIDVIPFEVTTEMDTVLLPCQGDVTLNVDVNTPVEDLSYFWSFTDGNISSDPDSPAIVVDKPGNYQLLVLFEDQDVACKQEIDILVEEISLEIITITTPDTIHCQNSVIELIAIQDDMTTEVVFFWSTDDGNIISTPDSPVVDVDAPGLYTVSIVESNSGCEISKSIEVFASIINDFDYELDTPDCNNENGSVIFHEINGGTPPYMYSINGGSSYSQDRVFMLAPGEYGIAVKDKFGCFSQASIVVPEPTSFNLELPPRVEIPKGSSYQILTISGIADSLIDQITWSPETGLDCSDCLSPIVMINTSTIYQIEIKDIFGCYSTASIDISIIDELPVYAPNAFSPNGDGNNDVFTIFGNLESVKEIERLVIFDRFGSEVFENFGFPPNDLSYGWSGEMNGRRLNPGVFLFSAKLEFHDGSYEIINGDFLLIR